jgi:hypothetical protein
MAKPDAIEEAHFRIDEHERRFAELDKAFSPEMLTGIAQGAVSVLGAELDRRLKEHSDHIVELLGKDVETDKEVVASIKELVTVIKELLISKSEVSHKELSEDIRELVKALRAPTTRTATVELPNGHATMTVRERKDS